MGITKRYIAALLLPALLGGCAVTAEKEFVTDGCSLFPDGNLEQRDLWLNCCIAHDRAYWAGGTEEQRKAADIALRDCVLDTTGNEALADLMYTGVRAGGQSYFPTHYRWGYGQPYEPLKKEN